VGSQPAIKSATASELFEALLAEQGRAIGQAHAPIVAGAFANGDPWDVGFADFSDPASPSRHFGVAVLSRKCPREIGRYGPMHPRCFLSGLPEDNERVIAQ
jgi:hypothetical protein